MSELVCCVASWVQLVYIVVCLHLSIVLLFCRLCNALLYTATVDGYGGANFHAKCDGKPRLLVIEVTRRRVVPLFYSRVLVHTFLL
jgi:hypothetical protein